METKTTSSSSTTSLTPNRLYLIETLKLLNLDKNSIVGIMLTMETEEMAAELMDWMSAHRNELTQVNIINKADEINPPNEDDYE